MIQKKGVKEDESEVIKIIYKNLERALQNRNISLYRVSALTGIRYELIRRIFRGMRKLSAEEMVLILEKTDIPFDEIK